jgi:DNA-binding HxlR family transcriptional regulator
MSRPTPFRDQIRVGSVNRALTVIGDRWTLLVLGQAFLGKTRFDEFLNETGIARSVLSNRLRRMIAEGLMRRVPAESNRFDYKLTRKGLDLYPVGLMGWRWEERWMMHRRGHPIYLVHRTCGRVMQPEFRCGSCHGAVLPGDVAYTRSEAKIAASKTATRLHRRSRVTGAAGKALIGASIDVIGDRWTFLILGALFLGLRRFDELHTDLKIATNILTGRLKRLTEEGLLRRSEYFDRRIRHEYRLNPKGLELFPMLMALMRWGDKWLTDGKPPHLHRHRVCGKEMRPVFACSECGEELLPWDVSAVTPEGRRMKPAAKPPARLLRSA